MDVEMNEKERKGWDGPPAAIWTLDLATEKVTRLTPKTLYAWDCHWLDAPDSILFVSQGAGEKEASIYRMSTTGQGKDRKLLIKNARIPGTSR
jgi:Tol biopolymer transport system component